MDAIKKMLGDELFNQVKEKLGDTELIIKTDNLIDKSTGDYVPRKVLNEQKEKYEALLTERDKDLAELKEEAGAGKKAKEQIELLQGKYDEQTTALKSELEKTKKVNAVELALIKQGAGDYSELLKPMIDLDKITEVKDGTFAGITEQVELIKTGKFKNLFGELRLQGDEPNLDGNSPVSKTKISQMQTEYDEAVKQHGLSSPYAIAIKNKLYDEQMRSTASARPENVNKE